MVWFVFIEMKWKILESNLNSTRLGIISANNWKISPFIPLFSNLKLKTKLKWFSFREREKGKGKGKGRKGNQVKPQSFQIGIALQSKWKQLGLIKAKVIRNKTSEERELVIAFKNKENGKGKKKDSNLNSLAKEKSGQRISRDGNLIWLFFKLRRGGYRNEKGVQKRSRIYEI